MSTPTAKEIRMNALHKIRCITLALMSCAVSLGALAQATAGSYEPSSGQAGKDVVWIPTPDKMVDRMLRMAEVSKDDFVVDLGSGDGKIAIAAARHFGARAVGLEYNPDMVELSKRRAREAGVQDKVEFRHADIFASYFSNASVVTMYLLPNLNLKLRPILFRMKPGTRVTSHSFDMAEWQPDETATVDHARAYLWIVPAHVGGDWKVSYRAGKLAAPRAWTLRQRFQAIEGEAQFSDVKASLQDARLRGSAISFTTRDTNGGQLHFSGTVEGERMTGSATSSRHGETRFVATRGNAPPAFPEAAEAVQEKIEAVRALGAD